MSHLADQLSALVDGELSGADLDRVNAHLAGCADCRAEAAALRRLKRALRALGEADDAADGEALTQRLLALAGPGGPVPSRQHHRERYRRASGRPAGQPTDARHARGRYLAWSVASLVLVGLGTVAFGMGGASAGNPVLDMQLSSQLKVTPAEGASTGSPGTRDKSARNPGKQAMGMRLLSKAASAGQGTVYTGVELMADSGVGGDVTTVTQVRHPGAGSPNGVFGLTTAQVSLLGKHYVALYRGGSVSAGRSVLVVELHRFDGSLAARFWLDQHTMLPLRREVFDTSAKLVSEDAFIQVRFGRPAQQDAMAIQPPARAAPLWSKVASPAAFLATLRRAGWRLPSTVAGGLPLYRAAKSKAGGRESISLGYSDGLFIISLLATRGTFAARPAGEPASLNGHLVYLSGHSVSWAAPGCVYTLTADAPPQAVAAVVATLPQSGPAGFLGRLGHGLDRLAALINPFG